MLNDSIQPTANGLLKSNSLTTSNKFDLTLPTKLNQIEYNEAVFRKLLNQDKIKFEFSNPIKIPLDINQARSNQPIVQSTPRTHVILVDQAPFSVFKSVKSQERVPEQKVIFFLINFF